MSRHALSASTSITLVAAAAATLLLAACSDDTKVAKKYDFSTPDAAVDGAAAEAGADGPLADTHPTPDQQITPDAPVSPCNPALDLKPLTLAPAYCVVYRFTLAAQPDAINLAGEELLTYALDKSAAPFSGSVQLRLIDTVSGKPGAASPYLSFTASTADAATKVFASNFLPRSAGGFVAASYTDSSFAGEIFWGDKGIKTPKQVDQASNYDAVFLDDTTLLVNGAGIGAAAGQGVYVIQEGKAAWRVITDIGELSGHLGLGQSVLFAGGAFGTSYENKIYAFTLAELKAAIVAKTALSAATAGDLIYTASYIPDAAALGDSLVAGPPDASYGFQSVKRVPVTVSGNNVTAGAATTLVTPAGGGNVSALAGSGSKRLGLLLSGTGKIEIAVVEEK